MCVWACARAFSYGIVCVYTGLARSEARVLAFMATTAAGGARTFQISAPGSAERLTPKKMKFGRFFDVDDVAPTCIVLTQSRSCVSVNIVFSAVAEQTFFSRERGLSVGLHYILFIVPQKGAFFK